MTQKREGQYNGKVTAWGIGKAKTSSNLVFWISFEASHYVEEGKEPEALPASFTRTITRPLTVKALPWLLDELKRLGFEDRNIHRLDPVHPDAYDFQGVAIEADLAYKEYPEGSGKTVENWSFHKVNKLPERPDNETVATHLSSLQSALEEIPA